MQLHDVMQPAPADAQNGGSFVHGVDRAEAHPHLPTISIPTTRASTAKALYVQMRPVRWGFMASPPSKTGP